MKMRPIPILFLLVTSSFAMSGPDFYDKKAEGWHWYHDTEEVDLLEKKKPEEKPPVAPAPAEEKEPVGPKALSHAWIQENLPMFRERAIDSEKEEDVRAYLYLQRLAVDKATTFASNAKLAVMKDPFLGEGDRRPTSSFGASAVDKNARENRKEILQAIAQETELWFFFDGKDCFECESQSKVMASVSRLHGFSVRPVSRDGMGTAEFPMPYSDKGRARNLGVTQFPSVLIIRPPNDKFIVSSGMLDAKSLTERILVLGESYGWINKDLLNKTRTVKDIQLNTKSDTGHDLRSTDEFLKFISNSKK